MSDSVAAKRGENGAPKVSRISEAVIRIAGNSQDGIQAIGGFLARLAGRSAQEVITFMTIPSTISGGFEHNEFGHPTGSPKLHIGSRDQRTGQRQVQGPQGLANPAADL